jgi:hypothetical protein
MSDLHDTDLDDSDLEEIEDDEIECFKCGGSGIAGNGEYHFSSVDDQPCYVCKGLGHYSKKDYDDLPF